LVRRIFFILFSFSIVIALLAPSEVNAQRDIPLCGFPITSQSAGLAKANLIHRSFPASDTTFYVRKDVSDSQSQDFIQAGFTKVLVTTKIVFYVETTEWESSRVTDTTIENLRAAMLDRTPQGSINPDQGIYENEVNLFGPPPDIDNNGKIFILLMNVRDNYDSTSGGEYVAGYFDPMDQTGRSGNHSDILYIDTYPGLQSSNFTHTMTTAAHELQHLIHWGADKEEAVWVNEGMSEVTAHLFNYPGRNFSYFLSNPTRTLTAFDQSVADYAKVGLWTLYLYSHYGSSLLTDIVRDPLHGITGLNDVFASNGLPDFDEMFSRWVVANIGTNYLPDVSSTAEYHYPDFSIPGLEAALTLSQFPATQKSALLKRYSASYIRFIGGTDLVPQFFPPSGIPMDATLLLSDGETYQTRSWQNVSLGGNYDFTNYQSYGNGWLVFTAKSTASSSGNYAITVDGVSTEIVETLNYGSGNFSFFIPPGGGTVATDFDLPSVSTKVHQAEVYLSDNSGVTLSVRETQESQSVLAEKRFTNPASGWLSWSLDSLDMTLGNLFFQVQSDSNAIGFDTTDASTGNSYYKGPHSTTYQPITDFNLQGGYTTNGNWMMRLLISYPGTPPTPDTTGKIQIVDWRNPWYMSNSTTSDVLFSFLLPERGTPEVHIYNILGQRVASPTSYPQSEKLQTVSWDATNANGVRVSSGVYFFTIQLGTERIVRKFTILW